jgi:hypothetical protein
MPKILLRAEKQLLLERIKQKLGMRFDDIDPQELERLIRIAHNVASRDVTPGTGVHEAIVQGVVFAAKRWIRKNNRAKRFPLEWADRQEQEQIRPPPAAMFLLSLILTRVDRQVLLGDLQEEYSTEIVPEFGPKRAYLWFWSQAVRAIATRNPICKWVLRFAVGSCVARLEEWLINKIIGG